MDQEMTDIETMLMAVNQTLEICIHMSARMDALEALLVEKGVLTEPEIRAQIAKLRTEKKDLSEAMRSMRRAVS